jgi:hypothetical protein
MNKNKLLIRMLASPIVFCLIVFTFNYYAIRRFILYFRWGGEWITYEKDDRETIDRIYLKLKKNDSKTV